MPSHRNGTRTKQEDNTGGALMPYGCGSTGLMTQIRDEFDRMFERFLRNWPRMGLMRAGEQGGHRGSGPGRPGGRQTGHRPRRIARV
jgi:hypothetical protein